ncbi:hypothetical protein H0H81_002572 [Sphagnurus paluster]|uniref:Uncharacterized protein n=1 Tax=Sphagnurus paluster TaxID=117069 RepID=A0A9P7FQB5_9AGAR|nr:hypothetical protein H0H81_002572 [Sphagnurus paluster]
MARDTVDPTNILTSKRISRAAPRLLDPANGADEADIAREGFRRDLIFREEPTVANERKHETEGNSGTGSKDNKESGWDLKLLDDEEDDMDIEPDGDDDDDVYLFDIS